ncbi:MAG TPA: 16S rRNA (uracil(1498)-N(3))-methyltransferase [Anaeromyxobacteraceae bacterium]|nr:16S rRNA (uracil(1498)-N(3))-methyltransferase [Anaeromyxobacteraceae bacterium]
MTRRRVHLPPDRIGDGRAALDEPARHYLRDVLRLAPGDPVELFDGRGAAWEATVGEGFEALRLGARREAAAGGTEVHLLFALAKGEKVDLVVQKATELGAARLAPFAAERSVVRLDEAKGAERAVRWRRIAEEAARQCGRSDVPEVAAPGPLAAALAAVPRGFRLVVLHGEGSAPLASVPLEGAPGVAAVVGPEGGLTPEELAACEAAGAIRAGLGPRTLRAETAAIAAVALLQALAGDLR